MRVKWLKQEITVGSIEKLTGSKVKSLAQGLIEAGITEDVPILKQGVEVDFAESPTQSALTLLDGALEKLGLERK